ncbi:hypothetical protein Lfu02_41720 [Longispora fulva]|uniref:Protein kinase domain-containing protein n=1 Tax=Longispora fulva TaxID=619741 RepID=A0A8J7GF64_9ACTN|nr:hypothetical protein [Longispora fulva]MBG6136631.1 hypothetical protein [Longispora fulva]GIG59800.1 hypothetical protein Lfu02_41720 [Longispora fulva]
MTVDDAALEELRLTAPDGTRRRLMVRLGPWRKPAGPGLSTRVVYNRAGVELGVMRAVPSGVGAAHPALYDALDREVRAGVRLARRYSAEYPEHLVRLLGYEFAARVPFAIVTPEQGEPVSRIGRALLLDEQRQFQVGLFRGLLLLAEAGVAHGSISAATVRWDAGAVWIGDLSAAAFHGEPRRPGGVAPWCSPEQRAGTGVTGPTDDMWAAGMLTYQVVTGRSVTGLAAGPDLTQRAPALRDLLAGLFDAADLRPGPERILVRLRSDADVPAGTADTGPEFEIGLRAFDEARHRKLAVPVPQPPQKASPLPGGMVVWLTGAAVLLVLVAVLLVVAVLR